MPLSLVSPTAFIPSFSPSSRQSSADDDYGLASPMALPDTPSSQARSGIALAWDLDPPSPTLDDAHARATRLFAQSKSVQRPERRASASAVAARAATPNPRNHRNYVPDRAASRITRSSLPTLPEVRAKARHGGIYSLLLKNKSAKQEPVLVEDAQNPEGTSCTPSLERLDVLITPCVHVVVHPLVVTAALSVSKVSVRMAYTVDSFRAALTSVLSCRSPHLARPARQSTEASTKCFEPATDRISLVSISRIWAQLESILLYSSLVALDRSNCIFV